MKVRSIKQEDGSLVYPIELGLFDVFQGKGWARHSRYRRLRSGTFVYVSGQQLSDSFLRSLKLA